MSESNDTFWNGHLDKRSYGDTIFRGTLQPLPYPDVPGSLTDQIEAMYSDGYVIFPAVLNADEVTVLRARIDAMGSQNDADYVVPKWCYNKQISSDFHRNPDLLDYIDRPGIIDVAEAILSSPDTGACRVIFGSSWVTGAGRQMGLHVDFLPIHLPESVHQDPNVRIPIFMATAHYYLDDMVLELGPTTLIPGSHRAGRAPRDETSFHGIEPQAALVKAGDVVLFRSDLWHGAAMNSDSSRHRYIMQVAYGMGYMCPFYPSLQAEALYAPEVLARITPRQRQLLR